MTVEIRKSFEKDAMKLSPNKKKEVAEIINKITAAKNLSELPSCKKLVGFKNAYRIRSGSYRIGFFLENQTVELVRVLDRKNIYRYFP